MVRNLIYVTSLLKEKLTEVGDHFNHRVSPDGHGNCRIVRQPLWKIKMDMKDDYVCVSQNYISITFSIKIGWFFVFVPKIITERVCQFPFLSNYCISFKSTPDLISSRSPWAMRPSAQVTYKLSVLLHTNFSFNY